jgi:putative peptidoglycan lipid II flippase
MTANACYDRSDAYGRFRPSPEDGSSPERSARVRSVRGTFLTVVTLALAGQLCAVAYEVAVAGRLGTGSEADALALGLTLVVAVASEIVTWISILFAPQYIEARIRTGTVAAAAFLRATALILIVGTALLGGALYAAAPPLIAHLAPALAAGDAVRLLRLFASLVVLLPLSALLAATLQAQQRFVTAGTRQLCWYGATLLSLFVLGPALGAAAVPLGMIAGIVLFSAILAARLGSGSGGADPGEPVTPRLRRMAAWLPPLALASGVNYVNVTVERALAARLPEGSLAALTYAYRLLNFPVTLFVLTATTMLFPTLALHVAREDIPALEAMVVRALRLTLVIAVPCAGLAVVLAEPAVRLLLERGAFTPESTRLTATALAWYAPGLVGLVGIQVLARAYHALQAIGRMTSIGVAVSAFSVLIMVVLTRMLGLRGLAAAATIAATVLFVAMLLGIRRQLPGLDLRTVAGCAGRSLAAAVVATGLTAVVPLLVDPGVTALAAAAVVGLAAYLLMLARLSRDDLWLVVGFVAPALARHSVDPA